MTEQPPGPPVIDLTSAAASAGPDGQHEPLSRAATEYRSAPRARWQKRADADSTFPVDRLSGTPDRRIDAQLIHEELQKFRECTIDLHLHNCWITGALDLSLMCLG